MADRNRLKKPVKSNKGIGLDEIVYWMASTFSWTWEDIMNTRISDMNFIINGCNKHIDRQNKEMKKQQGKSGKHSVNSLAGITSLPGVRRVRGKK